MELLRIRRLMFPEANTNDFLRDGMRASIQQQREWHCWTQLSGSLSESGLRFVTTLPKGGFCVRKNDSSGFSTGIIKRSRKRKHFSEPADICVTKALREPRDKWSITRRIWSFPRVSRKDHRRTSDLHFLHPCIVRVYTVTTEPERMVWLSTKNNTYISDQIASQFFCLEIMAYCFVIDILALKYQGMGPENCPSPREALFPTWRLCGGTKYIIYLDLLYKDNFAKSSGKSNSTSVL